MDDVLRKATPEQKLSILTNELIPLIATISGFAQLIKKDIESNNINRDELMEKINRIDEAAEKMRLLRDDVVGS